jgi:hypothetical protein
VRVPEEAGRGKVKVTLSFSSWKEGKVADATYEVDLADESTERDQAKE